MNKTIACFSLIILAFGAVCAEEQKVAQKPKKSFKELINKREGGFLIDKRGQKGRLAIVDAQSEASADNIRQATKLFVKDAKIDITYEKGSFDIKDPKRIGEATVFVISDNTLPVMMVAADDHWGFVNVAKLKDDREEFFKSRIRKEIVRVAGFVLGAGDSFQYHMCLTGQMKGLDYLDQIPSEQLPIDVMQRLYGAMPQIGITQYRMTTYRKAVEQGWAAEPTNDVQKAVWDKVHQLPTKPIKIEFDPKTDTK